MGRRHSQAGWSEWSPYEAEPHAELPRRASCRQFPPKDQVHAPYAFSYPGEDTQPELPSDPSPSSCGTMEQLSRAVLAQAGSPDAAVTRLMASFSKFDTQRQGALAASDFIAALRRVGLQMSEEQLRSVQDPFGTRSINRTSLESQQALDYAAFVAALRGLMLSSEWEKLSQQDTRGREWRKPVGGKTRYGSHTPELTSQLQLGCGDDISLRPDLSEHAAYADAAGLPQKDFDRKMRAASDGRDMSERQGVKHGYFQSATRPVPFGLGSAGSAVCEEQRNEEQLSSAFPAG